MPLIFSWYCETLNYLLWKNWSWPPCINMKGFFWNLLFVFHIWPKRVINFFENSYKITIWMTRQLSYSCTAPSCHNVVLWILLWQSLNVNINVFCRLNFIHLLFVYRRCDTINSQEKRLVLDLDTFINVIYVLYYKCIARCIVTVSRLAVQILNDNWCNRIAVVWPLTLIVMWP